MVNLLKTLMTQGQKHKWIIHANILKIDNRNRKIVVVLKYHWCDSSKISSYQIISTFCLSGTPWWNRNTVYKQTDTSSLSYFIQFSISAIQSTKFRFSPFLDTSWTWNFVMKLCSTTLFAKLRLVITSSAYIPYLHHESYLFMIPAHDSRICHVFVSCGYYLIHRPKLQCNQQRSGWINFCK